MPAELTRKSLSAAGKTRYGLAGIRALGALSLVHWGRVLQFEAPGVVTYLMGVLPNAAAAIAIPFVLLSIGSNQQSAATYQAARRRMVALTLSAGIGLIAWEYIQQSSSSLIFDHHDIAATILGLAVAWLLFVLLTPRADATAA